MKFHLTHYNRNNRIIKSRREPHKEKETKISSSFNFHQSNSPYSNPSSLLVNPSQPNHKSKECVKTLPSEMYSIRTLSRFSKRKVSPSKFLLSKDRLPNGPPFTKKQSSRCGLTWTEGIFRNEKGVDKPARSLYLHRG